MPNGLLDLMGDSLEAAGIMRLMESYKENIDGGLLILRLAIERGDESYLDPEQVAKAIQLSIEAITVFSKAIEGNAAVAQASDDTGISIEDLKQDLRETANRACDAYTKRLNDLLATRKEPNGS